MNSPRDPRRSLVVRADGNCDSARDARRDMASVTTLARDEWDRAQRVTVQFYGQPPADSYVGDAYITEVQHATFDLMGIPQLHLCNVPEQDLANINDPRVLYGLVGPNKDGRVGTLLLDATKDEYVAALHQMLERLGAQS